MFPADQILQYDCTRVLRTWPDVSVDLVVTDPPYGVRYRDRLNRTIANDDHPERILGAFNDVYRVWPPPSADAAISASSWTHGTANSRVGGSRISGRANQRCRPVSSTR